MIGLHHLLVPCSCTSMWTCKYKPAVCLEPGHLHVQLAAAAYRGCRQPLDVLRLLFTQKVVIYESTGLPGHCLYPAATVATGWGKHALKLGCKQCREPLLLLRAAEACRASAALGSLGLLVPAMLKGLCCHSRLSVSNANKARTISFHWVSPAVSNRFMKCVRHWSAVSTSVINTAFKARG